MVSRKLSNHSEFGLNEIDAISIISAPETPLYNEEQMSCEDFEYEDDKMESKWCQDYTSLPNSFKRRKIGSIVDDEQMPVIASVVSNQIKTESMSPVYFNNGENNNASELNGQSSNAIDFSCQSGSKMHRSMSSPNHHNPAGMCMWFNNRRTWLCY